jgi:hypothetical protein
VLAQEPAAAEPLDLKLSVVVRAVVRRASQHQPVVRRADAAPTNLDNPRPAVCPHLAAARMRVCASDGSCSRVTDLARE